MIGGGWGGVGEREANEEIEMAFPAVPEREGWGIAMGCRGFFVGGGEGVGVGGGVCGLVKGKGGAGRGERENCKNGLFGCLAWFCWRRRGCV